MAYFSHKRECATLWREVEDEQAKTAHWKKHYLDADRENAALKQRALDAERWATRKVDDNRANTIVAWGEADKEEKAAVYLHAEVRRRFVLRK